MEKYIVIVNQKYLVSVEAGSHGGAEHRCLDLVYGIHTAQAFSRDDLRTEFFRDNAILCETLSFSELEDKSKAYKAALDYEEGVGQAIKDNKTRIAELRRQLELLEENESTLFENLRESALERKQII